MISILVYDIDAFYDLDHITNDRIDIVRERLQRSDVNYVIRRFDEQGWVVKVCNIDMFDAFSIIKNRKIKESNYETDDND